MRAGGEDSFAEMTSAVDVGEEKGGDGHSSPRRNSFADSGDAADSHSNIFLFLGKDLILLRHRLRRLVSLFPFEEVSLLIMREEREEMRRTMDSFYCPCLLTFTSPRSAQSYILRQETEKREEKRLTTYALANVSLCTAVKVI